MLTDACTAGCMAGCMVWDLHHVTRCHATLEMRRDNPLGRDQPSYSPSCFTCMAPDCVRVAAYTPDCVRVAAYTPHWLRDNSSTILWFSLGDSEPGSCQRASDPYCILRVMMLGRMGSLGQTA